MSRRFRMSSSQYRGIKQTDYIVLDMLCWSQAHELLAKSSICKGHLLNRQWYFNTKKDTSVFHRGMQYQ